MKSSILEFKPIDLEQYQEVCVQFRVDSFSCSFGSSDRFCEEDRNGAERYLQWLRQRMTEIPNSCLYVWEGEQIIGQIEMSRWKHNPNCRLRQFILSNSRISRSRVWTTTRSICC